MSKIFETVKSALVDNLTTLDRPYAAGLHKYLYRDQFGEVYTPLADACRVSNMVVCIMGYELIQSIYGSTEYFVDPWSKQLSDNDLADMLTLAEAWFEENPDGLQEIWESLEI